MCNKRTLYRQCNGTNSVRKTKNYFAGGSDEVHFAMTAMFDAMTALSSKYNDTPEKASRPYDKTRDGFVISGGGGVLVLEEYEHAKARGAKIYAELTGYGATSDGYDMVAPSGEGAVRCMNMANILLKIKLIILIRMVHLHQSEI